MSFHVVVRFVFSNCDMFSVAPTEICDSTIFQHSSIVVSFDLQCMSRSRGQYMMSISPDQRVPSIFPHRIEIFRSVILISSTRWTNRHSQVDTFPIQVPMELLRTVFPLRGPQVDVRSNFVRKEPRGRQCLAKFVSWKTYPCIWTRWLRNLE